MPAARPRRNLASLSPLTPQDSSAPAPVRSQEREAIQSIAVYRRMLFDERRRNAKVQQILERYVESLETQIADMRGAYFSTLAAQLKVGN